MTVPSGPTTATGRSALPPGAVVPAYVHPYLDPGAWRQLERTGQGLRCVVVNVADGPRRERPAPEYVPVLADLASAGVRAAGYVDLDFGSRDPDDVLADVACWLRWYGLDAVFLDRFPATLPVADLVAAVRAEGARLVVANPGVYPDPELLAGLDACVTFEGPWERYIAMTEPEWARHAPPASLVHLVYDVPTAVLGDLLRSSAERGTPCYATGVGGTNPWRVLGSWTQEVRGTAPRTADTSVPETSRDLAAPVSRCPEGGAR